VANRAAGPPVSGVAGFYIDTICHLDPKKIFWTKPERGEKIS